MLRLPPYQYHQPDTLQDALQLLAAEEGRAMLIAGGTDLVPNMKHRLFTPDHVVSLSRIDALRGIREEDGTLRIGAMETLADVSRHPMVKAHAPALAQAAGQVAGPQLRNMGTLGGNICLDTRCTYYNQTEFWRQALGYCLKKDGTVCHVTRVGKKCVAAHSADTPPVLMALGGEVVLHGPSTSRTVSMQDFFVADGIRNTVRTPGEILSEIRIPISVAGRRSAYAKLRQRNAIDFPLLSVAVAGEFAEDGTVIDLRGVVSALGSRPKSLTGWDGIAVGHRLSDEIRDELGVRAEKQCHPLENIIVDPEWRRAMVPVFVDRALTQLASG